MVCVVQHEARLRPMNRHSIFETCNIDLLLFFMSLYCFFKLSGQLNKGINGCSFGASQSIRIIKTRKEAN